MAEQLQLLPPEETPFRFSDFLLGYSLFALVLWGWEAIASSLEVRPDIITADLTLETLAGALAVFVVIKRRSPNSAAFGLPIISKDRIGFLLAFPLSVLIQVLLLPFVSDLEEPTNPLGDRLTELTPGLAMIIAIITLAVLLPLSEELLFRGVLHSALRRRTGPVVTVALGAAIFSLVHLVGLDRSSEQPNLRLAVTFGTIFVFGLALGYARERTGRIGLPFFIHSGWNTFYLLYYFTL